MGRKGLPPPVNGMNGRLRNTPLRRVSRLTERLMSGIDYEQARLLRMNHFLFLHERLGHLNRLSVGGGFLVRSVLLSVLDSFSRAEERAD